MIDNKKVLVFLDEALFSKSTKTNYFWIRKGRTKF